MILQNLKINLMSIENIVFEETDSKKDKAIKTLLLNAGNNELTKELTKIGVTHTKVYRGLKTVYILRSKDFERTEVTL